MNVGERQELLTEFLCVMAKKGLVLCYLDKTHPNGPKWTPSGMTNSEEISSFIWEKKLEVANDT
jgi:hypothetical protein